MERLLHYAIQESGREKRVKIAEDLDVLPPDATTVGRVVTSFSNDEIIAALESNGFKVCLDLLDFFYETDPS